MNELTIRQTENKWMNKQSANKYTKNNKEAKKQFSEQKNEINGLKTLAWKWEMHMGISHCLFVFKLPMQNKKYGTSILAAKGFV